MWQAVYQLFPKPAGPSIRPTLGPSRIHEAFDSIWKVIMPYALLGVTSAITAVLIVAVAGDKMAHSPAAAILAGYAWDSTLQKLLR
jgi:hypothetical protein